MLFYSDDFMKLLCERECSSSSSNRSAEGVEWRDLLFFLDKPVNRPFRDKGSFLRKNLPIYPLRIATLELGIEIRANPKHRAASLLDTGSINPLSGRTYP